jgi:hypothetical protein
MPTNLVKNKADEAKWREAKAAARKQGQGENYAYVTAIYEKMKKKASATDLQRYIAQDHLLKTAGPLGGLALFGGGMLAGYLGIPALKRHLLIQKQQRELAKMYETAALAQTGRGRTPHGGGIR